MLRDEIYAKEREISPPPSDLFQITHPPQLTNQEMETIKLAA